VEDTTAPHVTCPGDQTVSSTSSSGAVVAFAATASDSVSGTLTPACTPPSGTSFPIGNTPVTCSVTDAAGNGGSCTFHVIVLPGYKPAGVSCNGNPGHVILQPINTDGTSVCKQGSTIPAKFRVFDANCNSVGTNGVVSNFRLIQIINSTVVSSVNESEDSTTPDNQFRWDPTDQLWIFNVSTKTLQKNKTYVYQIDLNDGSMIQFQFGLK
jgi:hypothetical protein